MLICMYKIINFILLKLFQNGNEILKCIWFCESASHEDSQFCCLQNNNKQIFKRQTNK